MTIPSIKDIDREHSELAKIDDNFKTLFGNVSVNLGTPESVEGVVCFLCERVRARFDLGFRFNSLQVPLVKDGGGAFGGVKLFDFVTGQLALESYYTGYSIVAGSGIDAGAVVQCGIGVSPPTVNLSQGAELTDNEVTLVAGVYDITLTNNIPLQIMNDSVLVTNPDGFHFNFWADIASDDDVLTLNGILLLSGRLIRP